MDGEESIFFTVVATAVIMFMGVWGIVEILLGTFDSEDHDEARCRDGEDCHVC